MHNLMHKSKPFYFTRRSVDGMKWGTIQFTLSHELANRFSLLNYECIEINKFSGCQRMWVRMKMKGKTGAFTRETHAHLSGKLQAPNKVISQR